MIASHAEISADRLYRFILTRVWDADGSRVVFIMLNPSTADAMQDDPTITRCIQRAKDWGHGGLTVVNLFAFRATEPAALRWTPDPIGPLNDTHIIRAAKDADLVVAAWGIHGRLHNRAKAVELMLKGERIPLYHLGLTKKGHPRHPLYVPYKQKPEPMGL